MSNYCETCQVKYTAREHHCVKEKACLTCKQEKPIADFAPYPSSFDGHRHVCIVCLAVEKEAEKKRRAAQKIEKIQRQEQEKVQRATDNILFRAYGYRWKKEPVQVVEGYDDYFEGWDKDRWVLYSPSGKSIMPSEAKEAIALLQIQKPGHPSALWAKKIFSLPNTVVLDTETTGFGTNDEIIDLSIVDVSGRIRFNKLIKCQQSTIPKEAKMVHHITEGMLRDAPTFPQFWDRLMQFLATKEIIIYNAEYDHRMLKQTAQRYNLQMPELRVHCIMEKYSAYVGQPTSSGTGYRSMKLAAACLHFNIPQSNAHRALSDAQATLSLLEKLAEMADSASEG